MKNFNYDKAQLNRKITNELYFLRSFRDDGFMTHTEIRIRPYICYLEILLESLEHIEYLENDYKKDDYIETNNIFNKYAKIDGYVDKDKQYVYVKYISYNKNNLSLKVTDIKRKISNLKELEDIKKIEDIYKNLNND